MRSMYVGRGITSLGSISSGKNTLESWQSISSKQASVCRVTTLQSRISGTDLRTAVPRRSINEVFTSVSISKIAYRDHPRRDLTNKFDAKVCQRYIKWPFHASEAKPRSLPASQS